MLSAFEKCGLKDHFTNIFFFYFKQKKVKCKNSAFPGIFLFLKVCVELTDSGIRRRGINMIQIMVGYFFCLEEFSGNNFLHSS